MELATKDTAARISGLLLVTYMSLYIHVGLCSWVGMGVEVVGGSESSVEGIR